MRLVSGCIGKCCWRVFVIQGLGGAGVYIECAETPVAVYTHNSNVSEGGFATFRDGSSRGTSRTPIRKVILLGKQLQAMAKFSPGYTIL